MDQKNKTIDIEGLRFHTDQPTELSFSQLYTWVIWQYPQRHGRGLCGAVSPPIAEYGWLPAVIKLREETVLIHAHHQETFSTPNIAAEQLDG